MKVDASRIQPPETEQTKRNARLEARQPEPKIPPRQTEKSTTSAETSPQKNQAQGAVRLLQEGHFKGVAALRLRINFFDQLSSLEHESIQATAQEGVAELALALKEKIADLNSNGLIGEEILPQFAELADTFITEIQNSVAGEKFDQQLLTPTLEQVHGNFHAALQNLLLPPKQPTLQAAEAVQVAATEEVPPEAEQGAEKSPSVTSTLETELPAGQTAASALNIVEESGDQGQLAASLDALDSTFRSQLSSIEERLQGAPLLSVPEQPDNNGAAYQKFLAIYREMQGMAAVSNEQAETKTP